MFYDFCVVLLKIVFTFVFRIKRVGEENVPKEGPLIVAFNHTSDFDPVIAGITCPRRLNFMAKAELFENKLFGGLIKRLGAFPVHRGKGDVGAIKTAFKIIENQGVMLIFPEGGRVKDGQRKSAKPGVAMIAQRCNVPVVPVHIIGEYKWMKKITVCYGEPVSFVNPSEAKPTQEDLQKFADDVLDTIYSLS